MIFCDACASAAVALPLNCSPGQRRERSGFGVYMVANTMVGVAVLALRTAEDCIVGEDVLEMSRADSRTVDLVAADVRMSFSVGASGRMVEQASAFRQAGKLAVNIVEVYEGSMLPAGTEGIRSQNVTTLFEIAVVVVRDV